MKPLFIVVRFPFASAFGGEERHTLDMCEFFAREHSVEPVFFGSCSVLIEEFTRRGWRTFPLLTAGRMTVTPLLALQNLILWPVYAFRMRRAFRTHFGSVPVFGALLLGFNEKVWLTPLLTQLGIPTVWVEHHQLDRAWFRKNPFLPLYKRLSRLVSVVTFGGQNTKELRARGVDTVVIPHGVSVPASAVTCRYEYENRIRQEQQLRSPIVFFSQWRLVFDKWMDIVCDVANRFSLVSQKPVMVILLGDGPEQTALQSHANVLSQQNPLFHYTHIPFGQQERYLQMLAGADIALACSRVPETFGLFPVEALSLGVPLVCTSQYAALESVDPCVVRQVAGPDVVDACLHSVCDILSLPIDSLQTLWDQTRIQSQVFDRQKMYKSYEILFRRQKNR